MIIQYMYIWPMPATLPTPQVMVMVLYGRCIPCGMGGGSAVGWVVCYRGIM